MTRKITSPVVQQAISGDMNVIGINIRKMTYTIHTSLLFDPHQKLWLTNVSIQVDKQSGLISSVTQRSAKDADIDDGDVDLRGYTVLPGFGK